MFTATLFCPEITLETNKLNSLTKRKFLYVISRFVNLQNSVKIKNEVEVYLGQQLKTVFYI